MPTSRQTSVATTVSSSGFEYTGGSGSATPVQVVDIQETTQAMGAVNSAQNASCQLANTIIGTTIAGNVVNAIEVWADGTVWDTTNNRSLNGLIDPSLMHRSGIS